MNNQLKYQLIASDYDMTLSDDEKGVSQYSRDTINEFIARGGKFVLATGRMLTSILPHAKSLNLTGELIAYQGAVTYDLDSLKITNSFPIPNKTAVEIIKKIENDNHVVQAYYGANYYVEKMNPFTEYYSKFCKVMPVITDIKLSEYVAQKGYDLLKIVVIIDDKVVHKYIDELEKLYGSITNITRSHNYFLEIVDAAASKGNAVKAVAEKYGISRDKVMTFGDATNDLSMIKYAGMGVAIGNAMPELKQSADYIAERVDEDGLAKTIRKFCFED